MGKLFKRADFFLAVTIIFVAVLLLTLPQLLEGDHLQAKIIENGIEVHKIDLNIINENRIIKVDGEIPLEIEVMEGKIRFVKSNCKDKLCVNFGWLSKAGDIAACLPARVVITIEGTKAPNEPDAIAG